MLSAVEVTDVMLIREKFMRDVAFYKILLTVRILLYHLCSKQNYTFVSGKRYSTVIYSFLHILLDNLLISKFMLANKILKFLPLTCILI